MDYELLSEVSVYRKDRISSDKVNKENYISTENMLPNRGGVESATTVASAKTFSAYKKGDILLSNIRPYFKKIWYADKEGGCSNDVLVVKAEKSVDSKFLYYVLSDNNFFNYSTVTSKGTKMPRGSKNAIMKYWVPDLDLPTQKKIADILSSYDELIKANNERIELLEQVAQELYKEWFVRFRFPGYENTKFENRIPEGWNVVKLGDYVEIKGGKRLPEGKTLCVETTEHPYIRIRDITASKFISLTNSFEYIDNETFDIIHRFTVNANDILISIVGTIGAIACVGKSLNGANLTENCVKLVNVRHFTNSYLYHFFNSDAGKGAIQAGIVGATQPKLPLYNIKRIKLLKPNTDLIVAFTKMIEPIDQEIMTLMDKSRNLTAQRDMLLPRLMSGKLEV